MAPTRPCLATSTGGEDKLADPLDIELLLEALPKVSVEGVNSQRLKGLPY